MGTFTVTIEVGDVQGQRFEQIEALADTGATLTSVPASLLESLGVTPARRDTFRLANGQRVEMGMGETRVRVEGLETSTWVLFGQEDAPILLGALTLEALLLGVDPFNRRLVPVEGLLMSASLY